MSTYLLDRRPTRDASQQLIGTTGPKENRDGIDR